MWKPLFRDEGLWMCLFNILTWLTCDCSSQWNWSGEERHSWQLDRFTSCSPFIGQPQVLGIHSRDVHVVTLVYSIQHGNETEEFWEREEKQIEQRNKLQMKSVFWPADDGCCLQCLSFEWRLSARWVCDGHGSRRTIWGSCDMPGLGHSVISNWLALLWFTLLTLMFYLNRAEQQCHIAEVANTTRIGVVSHPKEAPFPPRDL